MAYQSTIDYKKLLTGLMDEGASADDVKTALDSRVEKAQATKGLEQYAYDDTYTKALDYIQSKGAVNAQPNGYESENSGALTAARDKVTGFGAFDYDYENDPVYQSYKDQYTRSGQAAMEDTLAQVSARTGGLASSYAGQAGQQTYDAYMQELSDKIPELYENAYNKYLNEFSMANSQLSTLIDQDSTDYSRYLDEVNYQQTERQNTASNEYNTNYLQYLNNGQAADNTQTAYDNLASLISSTGYTPSAEELTAAGMSQGAANALRSYYANSLAKASGSGSGTEASDDDGIVSALAALTGKSESNIRALWNAGYDFSDYAQYLPALADYYGTKDQQSIVGTGSSYQVTLPDSGDKVSATEALRLVQQGLYQVTGYDSAGNPILAPASKTARTKAVMTTK